MGDSFGSVMRRLRLVRGVPLRELARRAHLDAGHLSRLENGRRPPTLDLAAVVDAVLDGGGVLVALAVPHDGAMLEPGAGTGRRIGQGTVTLIRDRVHQLRLLDDRVGGRESYGIVRAEVDAAATLLRDASYNERTGRGLLAVLGELCQIGGWVASDAGMHGEAERLYLCGVRAAHAGGDVATAANCLSSLAYQTAAVGDPNVAVTLARSAYRGASHVPATVRALLGERVAWAHAKAGDDRAAERALGAVEQAWTDRRPGDDPAWVYWFDPSEIEIMAGRVWTQLRRPLRAVPILERATEAYDPDSAREVALYLTWLAEALLQAREVDRAADTATRALDLSRSAGSARLADRVGAVRRLLRPHRRSPAVAAFEDRWRSVA